MQICVQTLATNFPATLRDTFQFYVTVADWGPLLMSRAILMSSLHLFESPNHLTDMNTKCVFSFNSSDISSFGCQMSCLVQSVDRDGHNILSLHPSSRYLRSLSLIYVDFFRRRVRAKKDGGAFIALESFSSAAISLSLLPRRSSVPLGCTDVIN